MSSSFTLVTSILYLTFSSLIQQPASGAQAQNLKQLTKLDKPLLFAYGTWEKRTRIDRGRFLATGEGITPRGGGGVNEDIDLSSCTECSPAIRVRCGADNKATRLGLLLIDKEGRSGRWEFLLPPNSDQFTLITPVDGASFDKPNSVEKSGTTDLKRIMQWQLSGGWESDDRFEVEVDGIYAMEPDVKMLEKRREREKRETAELDNRRKEAEALRAKYGVANPNSPTVQSVGAVASDILAVNIQAGTVTPGSLAAYTHRDGDSTREVKDAKGSLLQLILIRNGQEIGWLIGPKRDQLVAYETFTGDPLLDDVAEAPENYSISSTNDAAYRESTHPLKVWRKSKPNDWAQPWRGFAMSHTLYLKLPSDLAVGKTYAVNFGKLNVRTSTYSFTFKPESMRSEAVHINQIGYRPDDPVKCAFLSVWLGDGGSFSCKAGLRFRVVEDLTGKTVFTGNVAPPWKSETPERMFKDVNYNKTDVSRMDFSGLKIPGHYRVVVDGVGCSYPFTIGPNVWERAFHTQMKGLYNERSGIELGPPYTSFRKPRDLYPGDGQKVYQSTYSVLEHTGEFDVAKHGTSELVPNAWGGYHDAGDWNPRRATHLRVTMAQLELLEMFPNYFGKLKLNIPPTRGVPDLLTEALFEIDVFKRLQKPDGGVPYGIETASDPIDGEVSWLQSMDEYAYAPDPWSSYIYAASAARAARLLERGRPDLAGEYRASAMKAMQWAEAERMRLVAADKANQLSWEVRDDRNLAALMLYAATGEKSWHALFLEDSCLKTPGADLFVWDDHVQDAAAFAYANMKDRWTDPDMKATASKGIEKLARMDLDYAKGNVYNITTLTRSRPMFLGFYSTPDAQDLARAHYLTGKPEYLAGIVQSTQFQSGCNPNNMTYTVGVGTNSVKHPLHLDSRRTGQSAPEGLTVYGNVDLTTQNANWIAWPLAGGIDSLCRPSAWDWPVTEAYFDVFLFVAQNEFTVDVWANNVLVWGYLAARK